MKDVRLGMLCLGGGDLGGDPLRAAKGKNQAITEQAPTGLLPESKSEGRGYKREGHRLFAARNRSRKECTTGEPLMPMQGQPTPSVAGLNSAATSEDAKSKRLSIKRTRAKKKGSKGSSLRRKAPVSASLC